MICCVSRAKMYFEHQNFVISCSFALFFLIFWFSDFLMVFGWSDSQFRLRGLISCPGLLLNRSGLEFSSFSDFSLHMVSVCRFCKTESSAAIASWDLAPGPNWSFHILVPMSEAGSQFKLSAAEHEPKHCQKWQIFLSKRGLAAKGGFVKLAAQGRRITL